MKTLIAFLALLGLSVVTGCDSPKAEKAKAKVEEAAHDTAEAGKEAAHKAAEVGKEVVHDAAHAVKEGAEDLEEKTK